MTNASLETKFEPNLVENDEETIKWGWIWWWVLSDEMAGRVGEWAGDEHMVVIAIKRAVDEKVSEWRLGLAKQNWEIFLDRYLCPAIVSCGTNCFVRFQCCCSREDKKGRWDLCGCPLPLSFFV